MESILPVMPSRGSLALFFTSNMFGCAHVLPCSCCCFFFSCFNCLLSATLLSSLSSHTKEISGISEFHLPSSGLWVGHLRAAVPVFWYAAGGFAPNTSSVPEDLGGLPGGAGVAQRGSYSSGIEVTQRKMKEQERRNKKKEEREAKKLQTEFVYVVRLIGEFFFSSSGKLPNDRYTPPLKWPIGKCQSLWLLHCHFLNRFNW